MPINRPAELEAMMLSHPPRHSDGREARDPVPVPAPGAARGTRCLWSGSPSQPSPAKNIEARGGNSRPGELSTFRANSRPPGWKEEVLVGRCGRTFTHQGSIRSATSRYLAPCSLRGPGPVLDREPRAPKWRNGGRMPAARAKKEQPDGRLGRWMGAEGSVTKIPILQRLLILVVSYYCL